MCLLLLRRQHMNHHCLSQICLVCSIIYQVFVHVYSLHTPPNIVTNIIIIREREAIHYKTSFNPFFFSSCTLYRQLLFTCKLHTCIPTQYKLFRTQVKSSQWCLSQHSSFFIAYDLMELTKQKVSLSYINFDTRMIIMIEIAIR